MGYSRQHGTKGVNITTPTYFPGQLDVLKKIVDQFTPIAAGDLTSPMARIARMVTGEGAEKGASEARTKISESGLSGPALTKAFQGVSEMAVKAKAGATQDVWKMAQSFLQQLALAPPFASTAGRETGGGGVGYGLCSQCYIFKAFGEGYLEADVRSFRDTHYPKGGFVDRGYRWMSNWLVPAMEKSPLLKHIVRLVMVWPLSQYARWYYGRNHFGYAFTPLRYLWPKTWEMIGRVRYLREVK